MSDVKWIKIVTDIFDDEKILLIETLPEADSIIVIWFKILCLAGKQNNSGVFMMNGRMPYNEKMFATIFRRKEATVQLALKTFEEFGMIEIIEGAVTIPNWGKHQNFDKIETKNAYMKEYMRTYRSNQKLIAVETNGKTNCKTNVSEAEEIREDKNRLDKSSICPDKCPSKKERELFFESIWSLYPKKEGKGQVSDSQKNKLYIIGIEEVTRAINRYIEAKKGIEKQFLKQGSTFFNSGYVDYLDENYVPEELNKTTKREVVSIPEGWDD